MLRAATRNLCPSFEQSVELGEVQVSRMTVLDVGGFPMLRRINLVRRNVRIPAKPASEIYLKLTLTLPAPLLTVISSLLAALS